MFPDCECMANDPKCTNMYKLITGGSQKVESDDTVDLFNEDVEDDDDVEV